MEEKEIEIITSLKKNMNKPMPPLDNWREQIRQNGENWINEDKLIPFIETLLSSYHSRIDEVIEGKKKDAETAKSIGNDETIYAEAYNAALLDLKEEITEVFKGK